ncbi:MAG: RluA family pseudouridine synthase [Kiloniellales bacterium]
MAAEDTELRLDRWFRKHFPGLGHGRLEKLLRTGQIRVDGKRVKAGLRLQGGQVVRVPPLGGSEAGAPAARPARAVAVPSEDALRRLRDSVLYLDDWVIAIDKPAGLAVQGGSGQKTHLDAMLDGLRFEAAERPRLVHRLDKDTSGVLLLARNRQTARALTAAFKGQAVRKTYWAAVAGVPQPPRGRIDLPLGKQARGAGERTAAEAAEGQPAVTLYAVAARAGRTAAWLVLRPLTGRTHQLRVHCAAIGHPILGDGKYGGKVAFPGTLPGLRQLQLHAREIALPHPADGTTLRVTAPLPAHMEQTWQALRFDRAAGELVGDSLED